MDGKRDCAFSRSCRPDARLAVNIEQTLTQIKAGRETPSTLFIGDFGPTNLRGGIGVGACTA
jgi:hypothetical protein